MFSFKFWLIRQLAGKDAFVVNVHIERIDGKMILSPLHNYTMMGCARSRLFDIKVEGNETLSPAHKGENDD